MGLAECRDVIPDYSTHGRPHIVAIATYRWNILLKSAVKCKDLGSIASR